MSEETTLTVEVTDSFDPTDVIRAPDEDGTPEGPAIDVEGSMKRMDHYILCRSALAHPDVFGTDLYESGRASDLDENKTSLAAVLALLEGSNDPDRVHTLAGKAGGKTELWVEVLNALTEAGFGPEVEAVLPEPGPDGVPDSFGPTPVLMLGIILANYPVEMDNLTAAARARAPDIRAEWASTYVDMLDEFAP